MWLWNIYNGPLHFWSLLNLFSSVFKEKNIIDLSTPLRKVKNTNQNFLIINLSRNSNNNNTNFCH